jgi:hypothetical protein
MNTEPEPTQAAAPIVFLSYSHDSREHKQWVAKLATALRNKHVEVIFDQWDLEPGDDVPKFMERAVKNADRVLMVCSEPYVRKANDGKGGVGYEAMIVTGELVRDLGTRKFVPVIRQQGGEVAVPDCVSTRLYVDFSDEAEFESVLDALVKTIHQVTALVKPPLGPHPFADLSTPSPGVVERRAVEDAAFSTVLGDPVATYDAALNLATSGNTVGWRRLLKASGRRAAADLLEWREANAELPRFTQEKFDSLHDHAAGGVKCYMPFFAALVAGAESSEKEFSGQLGWIDEVSQPTGWKGEGSTYWIDFPELLLFVGHALVGAMLMESGCGRQVYDLATTRPPKRWRESESRPLFLDTSLTGWPNSLNHTCTIAWPFLVRQFMEPWAAKAFGSAEHALSALSAYYQFLSFLNFCYTSSKGHFESASKEMAWPVVVPQTFCRFDREVTNRGFRTFLAQRDLLLELLEENGLADPGRFENYWKKWMAECGKWLGSVYQWHRHFEIPQANLPSEIAAKKLKISDL